MVVLRATKKVLKTLPQSAADTDTSDTALGDWYVNRIVVDRKPLLLLVSEKSRLSLLAPARNVKTLPDRLKKMVTARLQRLNVEESLIRAEVNAMDVVRVGRTRDRSVTGQMVDFAKSVTYYMPVDGWDDSTLWFAEDRLSGTPCRTSNPSAKVIFPYETVVRLLIERWVTKPLHGVYE